MKQTTLKSFLINILTATSLIAIPLTTYANTPTFPHIETIGTSELSVDADIADISVTVIAEENTASLAKQKTDKAVTELINRLLKAGIARNAIQSANLQLSPKYVYDNNTRSNNQVGYRASRQITITIHELNKLNDILDKALAEGVNQINNIQFKSSQLQELTQQARQLAIKDAQQKALSLAQGFDQKLMGVWQVRYQSQHPIQPVMMRMDAAPKSSVGQSYQQAQITISDRVEVIYQLYQSK